MEGEFVRFEVIGGVPQASTEVTLYDVSGDVRPMRDGEIFWLTDIMTNGIQKLIGPAIRRDYFYDDPDGTGRTDANTILAAGGLNRIMRKYDFSYPIPIRRLMMITSDDFVTVTNWFGHGVIRAA